MTHKPILSALLVMAVAAALGWAGSMALRTTLENPAPAPTGEFAAPGSVPIGGPFALTDHKGIRVTEKNFQGRFLLVFFGFTHCPDVCPTTLYEIARTMTLLGPEAEAVQPLFISVDPERDNPETVAAYVNAFGANIVGLTGTPEEIAEVADAYHVYYEKVPTDPSAEGSDYTVSHQAFIFLMAPQGDYLTHFGFGTPADEMAATVRRAIDMFRE